jgi:adenosylmethionine-8-amino-7-oxononanoate aminotransferase
MPHLNNINDCTVWAPYAQHKTLSPPLLVQKAQGSSFQLQDGTWLLDTISSWWSVIFGYNHPKINQALFDQIHDFSHIMLGGLTHNPVQKCAKKLVEKLPQGLNHVFFADSGSVGVEVALKMALQYHKNKGLNSKNKFIALHNAYHGDTLGAMSVGDPSDKMHIALQDLFQNNFYFSAPDQNENIESSIQSLQKILELHSDQIAALIIEPLVQCYGGFKIHSAEFLKQVKELCHAHNVLVIFDDVATGFGRTGAFSASEKSGVCPDILILGKGLTAGYLGMSATISTTSVFESFWGDSQDLAFMHGPTFMGNALACSVSIASMELFDSENILEKVAQIEAIFKEEMQNFSHKHIKEIRIIGAILAIELYDSVHYKGFADFAKTKGLWTRPFGNTIYAMPAYILSPEEVHFICQVYKDWFNLSKVSCD